MRAAVAKRDADQVTWNPRFLQLRGHYAFHATVQRAGEHLGSARGYLKHAASFYRAPEALVHQRVELRWDRDIVWIEHRGRTVARYPRSYEIACWQPPPRLRPEPPAPATVTAIATPTVVPPELTDYAELCA